jgi:hypothetical protein
MCKNVEEFDGLNEDDEIEIGKVEAVETFWALKKAGVFIL